MTLLALAGIQSGCATYYWPASQLETPETIGNEGFGRGERLGRIEIASIQSGTDLLSEPSPQSPDSETGVTPNPALGMSPLNYTFGVTVGVTPELDVGIKIVPFAPMLARVKYLVYGDPETKAQSGNWSASVAASGGLLLATYQGQGVTFYSGNAAAIGGYRFFKYHLASLAPFISMAGISGVGTSSGSGFRYGASLGYQYDAAALIARLELTYASGSFTQAGVANQAGGIFPGALLGVKF